MPRKKAGGPTEFELRILNVLWERGPSTAREVLEDLESRSRRKLGYTTVLKMLQVMETKDMVSVDRSERSHVYGARLRRRPTLKRMVGEFVERAFDGDPAEMMLHLLHEGRIGEDELERIEDKIAELRAKEEG